jgi:hypothetical protein
MFLENHPQVPSSYQAREVKDSFRISGGEALELKVLFADLVSLEMSGQRTKLLQKGEILKEYSYGHVFCCGESDNWGIETIPDTQYINFANVIFTAHTESYNIHHFFLEVLPVLWAQREFVKGKSLVVMGSHDSRFAQEITDLLDLGIRVVTVPIGSLCSFTDSFYFETIPFRVYPKKILTEIRDYIWTKLSVEHPRKRKERNSEVLFLGRGDESRNRRKLVNELELLRYLERNFGEVKVIRPAQLHLQETIKLIGEAEVIIGPTGGALSNLIWARNILQFVEVVPDTYPGDTESQELSRLFTFKYDLMISRSTNAFINFASSDQEVILP